MIGSLIEEMLANAQEHYETIQEAQDRSYAFDDALVARIVRVHTDQLEDYWLFKEQLSRWSQDELSATQRREVERLQTQAVKLQEVLQTILAFAEARKPNTIEKVLGKSDVEVAVDFLSGKLRH